MTSESVAAYAHLIIHPVPDISIIGGIRYTDDKKTYTFSRLDPDTGLPAAIVGPLNGVSGTYTGDSWDFRTPGAGTWSIPSAHRASVR